MDDRLRQKILGLSQRLAIEEHERLAAAGTLVDLERLAVQMGDELTRQLAGVVLAARAAEVAGQQVHACPECRKECPVEAEAEPLILQGIRGEIEYEEPRCFCPRCRRAFSPSGERSEASSA